MTDDANLQISLTQIARCFAAYGRHLAVAFDGRAEEWSEVSVNDSGLPSEFRNMVVPLKAIEPEELETLVDRLNSWFSGAPWTMWSVFPLPVVAGLKYRFDNQVMLADEVMYIEPPGVPELTIEEVTDSAGVQTFERVREAAISDSRIPSWQRHEESPLDVRILSDGHRRWLGHIDGKVVATAAAFDDGVFSMIKNVATLHEFRRRGIGAAMTNVAFVSSPRPAMFDADPHAEQIYRKLGFANIGRIQYWAPRKH